MIENPMNERMVVGIIDEPNSDSILCTGPIPRKGDLMFLKDKDFVVDRVQFVYEKRNCVKIIVLVSNPK